MIPAARPQEALLVELAATLPGGRVLCNTAGWAQFACAYAAAQPQAAVVCWLLDLYQAAESRRVAAGWPQVAVVCEADPPAGPFDLVVWSFSRQGDGELARELLQAGHERLAVGGELIAAIDNPRDKWLHEVLRDIFPKVVRAARPAGALYRAVKTAPLKKLKNYAAEFTYRVGERLLHVRTRPGVFSHRRVDDGARALIKSLSEPLPERVLDLGCGSGAVGLAAAIQSPQVRLLGTDSNPRAVEALVWGADRNGVAAQVQAALDCDGQAVPAAAFDLVLANPPYYSHFRLAELFCRIAARALATGGRLLLVTKSPEWYRRPLPGLALDEIRPAGEYHLVSARRA
jgi:16S rRNA (guanine1207-N2)-methyltransferase